MRIIQILPLLIILNFSGCSTLLDKTSSRPNIVLIMADDIGYECFGAYGSRQYSTPNLDRLAAKGIRFRHAYSQPLCTPSRVKLMTGISNVRNYSAFSILNRDQKTFAHYLKDSGYRTMVAGKWQLLGANHYDEQFRGKGTWPQDAGFEQYCLWQVDEFGQRYWEPLLNIDGENRQFPPDRYGPDVVTDYLCDFMEVNRDVPFLAYYPMILVHNPFLPTPDSSDRESKNEQSNFEDMVTYMDKLIGRIIRKTEALGISDRTLVIFTGDNGTNRKIQSVLDNRLVQGGKGLTTDAGNRVPLIAYWPGTIPGGQVSDDLIDFSDILPTLLEAAEVKVPGQIDGRTFFPQLTGQPGSPRDWFYTYYNPRPERTEPVRFVRDQRWKLYGNGLFFDIADDPLEQNPVLEPPDEVRKKLSRALASMPEEGMSLLEYAP